jgi:hypothetical protein
MAIKLNPTKANYVIDLLKANGNTFTPAQLLKAAGNDRRARSALSHARMAGIKLEAVRDGGKAVVSYRTTTTPTALAAPTATAKASKAKSAKAASSAKVATVKRMASEVVAKTTKKVAKVEVDVDAIKAKNLETMKAVTAKQKLHPVTKRPMTDEQSAILDEFAQMEAEAAAEERAAARASVSEYLKRESYSE